MISKIQRCVYCAELLILVTIMNIEGFSNLNNPKVLVVRGS